MDSPDFKTQRRNLIYISSIIIFYEIGKLEVLNGTEVHLPLVDLVIKNPEAIEIFLHAILIYIAWRYFTIFTTQGIKNKSFRPYIEDVEIEIKNKAFKTAAKILKKNKIKYTRITPAYLAPEEEWETALDGKQIFNKGGRYFLNYYYDNKTGQSSRRSFENQIIIDSSKLFIIKTKKILIHFFTREIFLEFYFPIFILAIALLESFQINITKYFLPLLNW